MAGKGSRPRPVDPQRYSENWEKIFRKVAPSEKLENNRCPTK